jgi:hypothetical protein
MATITADRLLYKQSGTTTDAEFVRIQKQDFSMLYFTNAVEDVTMTQRVNSIGIVENLFAPVTYKSVGYRKSATYSGADFEPGTADVEGILTALGVSREDILRGLFNQARIWCFTSNYLDPKEDDENLITGFWGETELQDGTFTASFRTLIDLLSTRVGRSWTAPCDTKLGTTRCGVNLGLQVWISDSPYTARSGVDAKIGDIIIPPTFTGFNYKCLTTGTSGSVEPVWPTVIGGTVVDGTTEWEAVYPFVIDGTVTGLTGNKYSFVDSTRTEPDDWWAEGTLTWWSGDNINCRMDVKIHNQGTTTVTFKQNTPFQMQVGDGYTIVVGCKKRFTNDCKNKFGNGINHQGHPWMPGREFVGKFGGQ